MSMNYKKHNLKIIMPGFICICMVLTYNCFTNPLRRSNNSIHSWLLKKVTVGSSESHFMEVAKREGWEISYSAWQGPMMDIKGWGGFDPDTPLFGRKFFIVNVGHYFAVFTVDIQTIWAFDEKGNFVDLRVRRCADGL